MALHPQHGKHRLRCSPPAPSLPAQPAQPSRCLSSPLGLLPLIQHLQYPVRELLRVHIRRAGLARPDADAEVFDPVREVVRVVPHGQDDLRDAGGDGFVERVGAPVVDGAADVAGGEDGDGVRVEPGEDLDSGGVGG